MGPTSGAGELSPKPLCVGCVLSGLLGLASVGEEAPSLQRLEEPRWGDTREGPTRSEEKGSGKGSGGGRGLWEGMTWSGSSEQNEK